MMRSLEAVHEALKLLQASLQHAEDDTKGSGPVNNLLKELEKIYDATSPIHSAVEHLRGACSLYADEKRERIQLALRSADFLASQLANDLHELSGWVASKPGDRVEEPKIVNWIRTSEFSSNLATEDLHPESRTPIASPNRIETNLPKAQPIANGHDNIPRSVLPKSAGFHIRPVRRKVDIAKAFEKLNSADLLELSQKDAKNLWAGIRRKSPTKVSNETFSAAAAL